MLRARLTSGFWDIYFKTVTIYCFMKILFKLAITRRAVFSSKRTQNRLSAWFCSLPGPAGGAYRPTSKEGEGRAGQERVGSEGKGRGGEGKEGARACPHTDNFWLRHCAEYGKLDY